MKDKLANHIVLFYLRFRFWLLEKISHRWAATSAWKLMCSPRRYPVRDFELNALGKATRFRSKYGTGEIQLYRWGDGAQKVLLVHGWEGHAGNFAGLIEPLLAQNCTVLAFDAPGHGASDRQATSMFDFGSCVEKLLNEHEIDMLITHSFGSVATVMALEKLSYRKASALVMLTAPNRFEERLNEVIQLLGLSQATKREMIDLIERENETKVRDLVLSNHCPRLHVRRSLIVHDRNDRVVPIASSREIAAGWDRATLVEIEGTGHYRILTSERVYSLVMDFLFPAETAEPKSKHTLSPT